MKAKRHRPAVPDDVFYFWIQRFYCKHARRTFSRVPDFLHPRKGHSQAVVGDVFEAHLGNGLGLCETAQNFGMSYQTVQQWLKGFARHRQGKAGCFSRFGPLDGLFRAKRRAWCAGLWRLLRKAYPGGVERALIKASQVVIAGTGQPLY